ARLDGQVAAALELKLRDAPGVRVDVEVEQLAEHLAAVGRDLRAAQRLEAAAPRILLARQALARDLGVGEDDVAPDALDVLGVDEALLAADAARAQRDARDLRGLGIDEDVADPAEGRPLLLAD